MLWQENDIRISIIIPAKNEGNSIADIIEASFAFSRDVLVIDGHSTDNTASVAHALGARVVLDNGKGKGDALRVGAYHALHETLVFLDADGSHDPHDIPALVRPILRRQCDMVIASRILGGSAELFGTWDHLLRRWGTFVINAGINLRFQSRITDSQNGFRAIRKETFFQLGLTENLHTIEQEMTMACLRIGAKVLEIPSFEFARRYGASHIKVHSVWWRYGLSWLRGLARKRQHAYHHEPDHRKNISQPLGGVSLKGEPVNSGL